jgi:hypothetical protein
LVIALSHLWRSSAVPDLFNEYDIVRYNLLSQCYAVCSKSDDGRRSFVGGVVRGRSSLVVAIKDLLELCQRLRFDLKQSMDDAVQFLAADRITGKFSLLTFARKS